MALSTMVKERVNAVFLRHLNLHLDTLTADRVETARLLRLSEHGHFDQIAYPRPDWYSSLEVPEILDVTRKHHTRFRDFAQLSRNPNAYSFNNSYFSSPDAEILYTIISMYRPGHIVEIGCGHSTRLAREAITDSQLKTELVCIDPRPREDIRPVADRFIESQVEFVDLELFDRLSGNDILFIDSSHFVAIGNDVAFLYLQVLPRLRPGVLIHIHDIFLPFEYPFKWMGDKTLRFTEQYVVQALLAGSERFKVLWAGYYLQKTDPSFPNCFPNLRSGFGSSMWLQVR